MSHKNQVLNDFASGKPQDIERMIDYQNDAVVSKILIKKPTGTVTLFAFDQGQGLSEHTTPFDAMLYLIDGEVAVTIAKNSHIIKKGEIILLPANIPHALSATHPFKMLLTMIKS